MVSLRQLLVHVHKAGQSDATSHLRERRLSPFCAGGKLLPEIYILGGPKCGTTELSEDMMLSGIQSVAALSDAGPYFPGFMKEFHYFIRRWRAENHTWELDASRESWFASMPPCTEGSGSGERPISGDFSPTQLALASPGDGWRISDTQDPQDVNIVDINLPQTLHSFYSHLVGADSNRVRFIVNFREPLSRMQSHWYHRLILGNASIPFKLGANFSEDVKRAVDEFGQGRVSMQLWYSLYGRQVRQYLAAFSPEQFIFIPYLYYVKFAKAEVCSTLSDFVGYPVSCKGVVNADETWLHNDHPTVEEDVPADLIERFQDMIADDNRLLVQQLCTGFQGGATLAHFLETPSAEAVEAWLKEGW